jgi:hypothetical protein
MIGCECKFLVKFTFHQAAAWLGKVATSPSWMGFIVYACSRRIVALQTHKKHAMHLKCATTVTHHGNCSLDIVTDLEPILLYGQLQYASSICHGVSSLVSCSNSLLYNNSLVLVEQCRVDARIKLRCWRKSSSPDTQGVARGLHS